MNLSESLGARPFWMETTLPSYPTLNRDLHVDVVIVGGGITGITTAYLLHNEGARVALLERGRLASADSGHTTAHLTYVTDYRLHELAKRFGNDGAKSFWDAGAAAIKQIEDNVQQSRLDCEFKRVGGYLHDSVRDTDPQSREQERRQLQQDLKLAHEFGFSADWVDSVPCMQQAGIHFADQAKFHPRKYLRGILQSLPSEDCYIFENTEFQEVESGPLIVRANGRRIRCDYLVIATHNPLIGRKGVIGATLFQTKLSLYTSYVLGARLPKGLIPEALFWDTDDPYDYLRVETYDDHQYAIFGGSDVKTGQEDSTTDVFERLSSRLLSLMPEADITHRWLGQVIETDDGLPYIGENADREFIATGFSGNGYTLGTVAAMMARDRFLGRSNAWSDLFRVDRKPFHGGVWRYLSENADYPAHLVADRFKSTSTSLADLDKGQGAVVSFEGKKIAAYRNELGQLSTCSAVCTHMRCLVNWNEVDKTWDCPCHGSRFHADGSVHSGPAEKPLPHVDVHDPYDRSDAGEPAPLLQWARADTPPASPT